MADNLGMAEAISSIDTIASGTARVANSIYRLSGQVGAAAPEVEDFARCIGDYSSVVSLTLNSLLLECPRQRAHLTSIWGYLSQHQIIERLEDQSRQMEKSIKRIKPRLKALRSKLGWMGKVRWSSRRAEVQGLKLEMESMKTTILIVHLVVNLEAATRNGRFLEVKVVKMQLKALVKGLRMMRRRMMRFPDMKHDFNIMYGSQSSMIDLAEGMTRSGGAASSVHAPSVHSKRHKRRRSPIATPGDPTFSFRPQRATPAVVVTPPPVVIPPENVSYSVWSQPQQSRRSPSSGDPPLSTTHTDEVRSRTSSRNSRPASGQSVRERARTPTIVVEDVDSPSAPTNNSRPHVVFEQPPNASPIEGSSRDHEETRDSGRRSRNSEGPAIPSQPTIFSKRAGGFHTGRIRGKVVIGTVIPDLESNIIAERLARELGVVIDPLGELTGPLTFALSDGGSVSSIGNASFRWREDTEDSAGFTMHCAVVRHNIGSMELVLGRPFVHKQRAKYAK
ncbi:hypothetical protein BP5796_06206 [Coleophoma crateriformis]|uniref:Uncharacterized protein n=1 Tax=Coleophoma crateriformis TaxID=565419 RepID=A0A3D8RWY9_9HELO|nr:hypothetical protein BP5796_06206 [Coleophoma crateriformis]